MTHPVSLSSCQPMRTLAVKSWLCWWLQAMFYHHNNIMNTSSSSWWFFFMIWCCCFGGGRERSVHPRDFPFLFVLLTRGRKEGGVLAGKNFPWPKNGAPTTTHHETTTTKKNSADHHVLLPIYFVHAPKFSFFVVQSHQQHKYIIIYQHLRFHYFHPGTNTPILSLSLSLSLSWEINNKNSI